MFDIDVVIQRKKSLKQYCCLEKKDGIIQLKRNHNYYFQVRV